MGFYKSDIEVIIKDLFTVLTFIGIMFIVPIIIALIYGEYNTVPIFLITGLSISVISYVLSKRIKTEKTTEFRHALVIVALVWLVVAVVSAIPFMLILKISFLDSFFESMAAWTTTGFTVIENVETAPFTLLFWRSFMQWVGGIGIVVAVLAGIFRIGGSLFFAEAREERIKPNVLNTIKTIWWIYIFYTVVGILLLALFGMPLFDSLNHAMTAISTGGMTVKSLGIGDYQNFYIEIVCMILMLLGAISFLSHFHLLKGNIREFIKDVQLKSLIIVLIFASILLIPFVPSSREILFQVFSASTATGFSTANLSTWNDFSKSILILLMIMGGAAGSTAGGLKLIRVNIFLKSIYWNLKQLITPGIIISKKIGDRILKDEEIKNISLFILIYLTLLAIGTIVLIGLGFPGMNSIFEVASAQGNVGLSIGIVSSNLHYLGKLMLIINMWIGRLEIWAILILIGAIFIRR